MDPDIPVTGDDWTKVSDPRERKRIQDRLAKRLSRQRRRESVAESSSTAQLGPGGISSNSQAGIADQLAQPGFQHGALVHSPSRRRSSVVDPDVFYMAITAGTVIHALTANAQSIPVYCDVFIPSVLTASTTAPESLMPTALQSEIPHLAFVAALPFTGLRDAILKALPSIDYDGLWRDSVKGGFYVWGKTPWMPQGWEVTEEWAAKWWFLLDKEVVDTANFWRLQRGLPKLRIRRPALTLPPVENAVDAPVQPQPHADAA